MMGFGSYLTEARIREFGALEKVLGYRFRDPELLRQALTHKSFDQKKNYERLEFFGDAVLERITREMLYRRYEGNEGRLASMKNHIVSKAGVVSVARSIGLDRLIRRGPKENVNDKMLTDVMEAVIGAMVIDNKFSDVRARRFVGAHWEPVFKRAEEIDQVAQNSSSKVGEFTRDMDWKSWLQREVQKDGRAPDYVIIGREGPEDRPTFIVKVTHTTRRYGTHEAIGKGGSKKGAEQRAAYNALYNLQHRISRAGGTHARPIGRHP